jgi:Cu/Ag efflux pump CusA
LQKQVQLQLQGIEVANVPDGVQYFVIRLRYPDPEGNSLHRMQQMQIFLPDGTLKPITQFARIKPENRGSRN